MNDKNLKQPQGNRRAFLKLLGAAGATAAAATLLDTYAPGINFGQQAGHTWRTFEMNATASTQMQEIVRYATLAANGHNAQAWKFVIQRNGIQIYPDNTRRLPVVDPHERELWISLGCALENLLIAARATGYAGEVTYPAGNDLIDVRLAPNAPQKEALFDAIPRRQNTRSVFDGQAVQAADLDALQSLPLEPGIMLRFFEGPANLKIVLEYVKQGNIQQYADQEFVDELIHWLRFTKKEALASMDGLFTRCTGNPEVPRFIGQMFVAGTKPQQQAEADAQKLNSSAGAVVIASETDDQAGWVRTGQVYQRLALKMTALNIKSALLNQPIEVASLRPQFQSAVGLGTCLPQMLVRYGYAQALPRALRRPVEQVLLA